MHHDIPAEVNENQGFSLLSMVLALAILCIIMAYWLPAYLNTMQQTGISSQSKSPAALQKSLENQVDQINEKTKKRSEQYQKFIP